MYVQVIAVSLLPTTLILAFIILNEESFMGAHVNTRCQNAANLSIIIFVVLVSTLLAVTTLFPGLLGTGR